MPALIDGKKDGLSTENTSVQSAFSAIGAATLSLSAMTLLPARRAASATRTISWE